MSLKNNTVAVVDYGMGNLRSVSQAVRTAAADTGWDVLVTADPEVVFAANRVVLPGQGAMPDCMRELRESGLQEAVLDAAANKPLFGVCVGMQMLLDHSDEAAAMSQEEFESEIQRCVWGAENGGTSQGRKSYFKRLVWLEKQRKELFGITAPRRAFRER